ncbi:OLC1v1006543C6 [Oldenlandia corymbosa var. corymbosa]|uniref:OLC1v1006543C6 n=1 Tax=Oldenlandia corymbosa var. corymbosa TaxID=529605 RepID=A0AAV1DHS7_OLDCO|nr:OLC1v1006543C6 [Oldenlandia corymbosa var. corymbosa]
MAASANPSGGGHPNGTNHNTGNNGQEGAGNGNGVTTNGVSVPDNSVLGPTKAALRHDPGISAQWTSEEQSLLEDLLNKYASDTNIVRYAKIAMELKDKTVRDVALRCRWMNKKENGKRRKDDHSSRKSKDKKEKVTDSAPKSHVANRTNGPPYAQSVMSMDSDDGISYKAIGGATGQLLEQNAQALDQISANFNAFKIHENINLFCQARNNILSIMNEYVTLVLN